tara:strand:- start:411 stop:656 length:246 start_codon:yes stop_codon:yes gene_type:complete
MIEYIRSFLDEITVQALQINILIWLLLWIMINLFNFFKNQKLTILESKYLNDFSLTVYFTLSFVIIRYYIKMNFIEKYLTF